MNTKSLYIKEIEGLRTFSFLFILFYHLDENNLPGGHIGIDIFFVISGFLMSKLIFNEIKITSNFNFTKFYLKRIRRLIPALLVTLCLSYAVSFLILSPGYFVDFSKSMISSLFSLSNVYFWIEGGHFSGYFDMSSRLKPLLHTWSLGVEEQFYFLLPIYIFFIAKVKSKKVVFMTTLAVTLASFFSSILLLYKKDFLGIGYFDFSSTTYYFTPLRFFEFLIGTLYYLSSRQFKAKVPSLLRELIVFLSISLILYSAIYYNKDIIYPGFYALLPCLCSILLIHFSHDTKLGYVLRNPVFIFLGKRTYSLYLIHWPIISFTYFLYLESFSLQMQLTLTGVIFASGLAMYNLIEKPFRYMNIARKEKFYYSFLFLFLCFLVTISTTTVLMNGLHFRLNPKKSEKLLEKGSTSFKYLSGQSGESCGGEVCSINEGEYSEPIYIIGDSFSKHLSYGLEKHFPKQRFIVIDNILCTFILPNLFWGEYDARYESDCVERTKKVFKEIKEKNAKVIISRGWSLSAQMLYNVNEKSRTLIEKRVLKDFTNQENAQYIEQKMSQFKKEYKIKAVLVFSDPPTSLGHTGIFETTELCYFRPNFINILPQCCVETEKYQDIKQYRYLANYAQNKSMYIDLFSPFCDTEKCRMLDPEGYILFDGFHFSRWGADKAIHYFKKEISEFIRKR